MLKKQYLFLLVVVFILNACSSDSDSDVDEPESCLQVGNLSPNISATQISIDYSTSSTANSFEIEYGITGFALGTGNRFVTSNNFVIEDLTPNTTYDIYITSICSSQDRSVPAELLAVTTSQSQCVFNKTLSASQFNLDEIFVILTYTDDISIQDFEYEYGLEGFTLGTGTVINDSSSIIDITDFEPATTYDIYARARCSGADFSSYAMTTITTSDSCPKPTELQAIFNGGSCSGGGAQYTFDWEYTIASSNVSFFDVSIPFTEVDAPVSDFTTSNTQITISGFSCSNRFVYVRANCVDGNVSEWAGPIPFN